MKIAILVQELTHQSIVKMADARQHHQPEDERAFHPIETLLRPSHNLCAQINIESQLKYQVTALGKIYTGEKQSPDAQQLAGYQIDHQHVSLSPCQTKLGFYKLHQLTK